MDKLATAVVVFIVALVSVLLGALFTGWFTELLLNYLFNPSVLLAIFGVAKLTFWKAYLLNVLTGLLFKSNVK